MNLEAHRSNCATYQATVDDLLICLIPEVFCAAQQIFVDSAQLFMHEMAFTMNPQHVLCLIIMNIYVMCRVLMCGLAVIAIKCH